LRAVARFAHRSGAKVGVRVQVSAGFVLGAGIKVEECSDEIPLRRGKNRDDLSRFLNKKAGNNLPILSMLWLVQFI